MSTLHAPLFSIFSVLEDSLLLLPLPDPLSLQGHYTRRRRRRRRQYKLLWAFYRERERNAAVHKSLKEQFNICINILYYSSKSNGNDNELCPTSSPI